MTEIKNKLAFTLLLVVVVTTMITAFTFFQVEQITPQKEVSDHNTGKVSINIPGKEVVHQTATESASVSINIER